ncbi:MULTISPECIES: hypothetical protein [Microbacterium]|uniref:hypothetical protein n=1 Tax=Microbacterium TaxID=33882 RepID=UPI00278AFDC8|nr:MULTISPECIES: hypothetical protein [Microbacterium]MDQ1084897.1 hypothetical protein [Microbacterium sp. SORGH_AS_0344]MDQ1169825.1 hypothetical protein [Microbacterium proteolyticum]
MSLSSPSPRALLVASLVMVAAVMTAFHVLLIQRGSVDQWSVALLLLVAATLVGTLRVLRPEFLARPATFLVVHLVAYLLVAGSIAVHVMATGDQLNGARGLVWMVACWGAGLLVHALGTADTFLPRSRRV